MSDNEVGKWTTAPDGLKIPVKTPVYPEAEGYLAHIVKDVDHPEPIVKEYAQLLKQKTEMLISETITIEDFGDQVPNNYNTHVSHLNHMRDAIIRTWHLRAAKIARMEAEKHLWEKE